MSSPLLIRAFVTERLTAAAEEIFQVFERTIAKYEEEASSSQQEIERLRGLLLDKREMNFLFSGEDREVWAGQEQEEKQAGEFNDADASYPSHSSVWEENEREDTKPSLTVQFILPLALTSSSQTQAQSESVQDGRESQRPAASFTSEQTQTSFSTSTELPHFNSAAPDYHCHLCNKSFSSSHHLINHAFHVHSTDTGALCAVCGKTFESTESLNVHLKSHKGSKCCQMCGKQCNSRTALTEHMASHAGVKLHRCHVCGKECSRKGDLKIHMRIHTGEKPFCCSFCCKSFTHSGHLRKHMRSHTGERESPDKSLVFFQSELKAIGKGQTD
uniref:C2H2-type domain-containing protein n=1 Tax=Amphilophus citrinellus TaxID=61819 RepID=A0A3Q0RR29_AMPCI